MEETKYGITTKQLMFNELKGIVADHPNFVLTTYKGLKSIEIEELRKLLQKSSSRYFVVKNSIAKRIFNEADLGGLEQFTKGEVGIGFFGDVIAASKTVVDFTKDHKELKLNCAVIDGKVESAERLKYLATLPPREELLALVVGYMKGPITGFVGVLSSLLRNFVYAINEIKKKKEEGANT